MKAGIFSSAIVLIALFLVSATIIYSRIPIQQLKTTAEVEGVKNFIFNTQMAKDIAESAFTETLSDEIYTRTDIATCTIIGTSLPSSEIQNRFADYTNFSDGAGPQDVDFGPCSINPVDSTLTNVAQSDKQGNVEIDIDIVCDPQPESEMKKILYQKTYKLRRTYELAGTGGVSDCEIRITDADAALVVFTQGFT